MQDKLEEYLRKSYINHITDHTMSTRINDNNEVIVCIHPSWDGGDTLDFKVKGNKIIPVFDFETMK